MLEEEAYECHCNLFEDAKVNIDTMHWMIKEGLADESDFEMEEECQENQ